MDLKNLINQHFGKSIESKIASVDKLTDAIAQAGQALTNTIFNGHKILMCGNGGSAADAQHFSAELVGRYKMERPPLAAIALSTDTSILTAVGNDYGLNAVFEKQVQALGNQGDILFAISTSGNSSNVIQAIEAAHQKQMTVIMLTGKDGGKMHSLCQEQDIEICVPSDITAHIQENHITIIHTLCEIIDTSLFGQEA